MKPKAESAVSMTGVWRGQNPTLGVLGQALKAQVPGVLTSGQLLLDSSEPAPLEIRGVGSRRQLFPVDMSSRAPILWASCLTHPGHGVPFSASALESQ